MKRLQRLSWRGTPALQVSALILASVALFLPPQLRLIELEEPNVRTHIYFAQQIAETGILYPAHFLYHVLVVTAHAFLPISWIQAHFIVILVPQVSLSVLLWFLVRRSLGTEQTTRDPLFPIVIALSLMFVSAISLFTWSISNNLYLGYIVPNPYVSQTLLVSRPFALLTFLAVIWVFHPQQPNRPIVTAFGLAIFASLSTIAKPSFVMCLIPAVAILLLLQRRFKDVRTLAIIGGGLVLPALTLILWQYTSTYLGVQDLTLGQDTGVRFAPFKVIARHHNMGMPDSTPFWLVPKFVLAILFPLTVLLCYFHEARDDLRLRLAWFQFGVGAFFAYFVAEYPKYQPGNFIWGAHITLFILFVISTLFFIEHTIVNHQSSWRVLVSSKCGALCSLTFLLHLISGVGLFINPALS